MQLAFFNTDQLRAVLAHLNIVPALDKAGMVNQVSEAIYTDKIQPSEVQAIATSTVPAPKVGGIDSDVRQQILDSNAKVHAALQDVVNAQTAISRVRSCRAAGGGCPLSPDIHDKPGR
jgi:hypothetical protein